MSDIQNIEKPYKRKASRSLTPVPEQLGWMIYTVNLLQRNVVLPDYWDSLPPYPEDKHSVTDDDIRLRFGKTLEVLLQEFPAALREGIWTGAINNPPRFAVDDWLNLSLEEILKAVRLYDAYRSGRANLLALVAHLKTSPVKEMPLTNPTYLKVNEQGLIDFEPAPDYFIGSVKGVEAARIRECQVCRMIFWAGRLDQKGCTNKCTRALRSRRWREKYQTTYKLRRSGYKPISSAKEEKPVSSKRVDKRIVLRKRNT